MLGGLIDQEGNDSAMKLSPNLTSVRLICVVFVMVVACSAYGKAASRSANTMRNPWTEVRQPSVNAAEVRGGYAGGCLHGAQSLLHDQGDFYLMRIARHRYYAHPAMRAFIKEFASKIKAAQLGVLRVGDISQPRGGPIFKSHNSHQVGLDADLWFWLDEPAGVRKVSHTEREQLSAISMLNAKRNGINHRRFGRQQIAVLKLAADDPRVQRIFVNPYIKQELCQVTKNAAWLEKIRPWWGHHYHFHVRLACPAGETQCRAQAPVPEGPGCGQDLAWWFTKEAADALRKGREKARQKTDQQRLAEKLARLPDTCSEVLSAP
jgi:penicillin-insensitive murein endopeptidase